MKTDDEKSRENADERTASSLKARPTCCNVIVAIVSIKQHKPHSDVLYIERHIMASHSGKNERNQEAAGPQTPS
ncbi:hypothetical protein [Achromobacter ruhlandii]|uniref:hypothetical protein n=1 Tax=Achromobacter ruhlandii TaxID=72557 RepID=UPI0018E256F2|nr:hypothetical protein [Achromobacter ruhlandii]